MADRLNKATHIPFNTRMKNVLAAFEVFSWLCLHRVRKSDVLKVMLTKEASPAP
jgi:hypothetical protein